jgi:hypothetical protein
MIFFIVACISYLPQLKYGKLLFSLPKYQNVVLENFNVDTIYTQKKKSSLKQRTYTDLKIK